MGAANRTIVELNDCDVAIVRAGEIVARSPAVAVLKQDRIELGDKASKSAHIDPRNTFNRFWSNLNQDNFKHPTKLARHNVDIAFAHLLFIHELAGKPDEMVFAVPGSFTTEQLSLLLGLVEASPFSITGLIDSAVAATAATAGPGVYNYLDIYLHHTILTTLEVSETVNRTAVRVINDVGLIAMHDTCANFIADLFIQQSRFDPLRQAESERALYEQLPQCLRLLKSETKVTLHIQYENAGYQAELNREALVNILQPLYGKITGAIDPSVPCLLNERLACLPAFADNLANATVLHEHAVFDGCMSYALPDKSAGEGIYFVTQLKAASNPAVTSLPATSQSIGQDLNESETHIHILVDNMAYPIKQAPSYLALTGAVTGDKRQDSGCSVALKDSAAMLNAENSSTVFINGQPAIGRPELKPGDVLSFAGGGIEFTIISVLA